MGNMLLVTVKGDIYDRLAMMLQNDLTVRIAKNRVRRVLIAIFSLNIVDSFIGGVISNTASMTRVLRKNRSGWNAVRYFHHAG